ncbi:MAG TPA: undecaprenyl-diphosphate phosphatase [Armatimonadetes bacterium]|nr:undecaprenyl-diphosphate phosphatase [Armatimonadota bacterium]
MSSVQAFFLGLVQGLTEFLPVSSSGHLVVVPYLFGWERLEHQVAFDVLLHVGTLVSLGLYFRREWGTLIRAWGRSWRHLLSRAAFAQQWRESAEARLVWLVLLTLLPLGLLAAPLRNWVLSLSRNVAWVASCLLVTGLLVWGGERKGKGQRTWRQITVADALLIGLAQCLGVLHGISRSGMTLAAGLWRGLDREAAPRFAFLMSVPAIAAAAVAEVPELAQTNSLGWLPCIVGFIVAAAAGYFALRVVFRFVQAGKLSYFAYYCWALGLITLLVLGLRG